MNPPHTASWGALWRHWLGQRWTGSLLSRNPPLKEGQSQQSPAQSPEKIEMDGLNFIDVSRKDYTCYCSEVQGKAKYCSIMLIITCSVVGNASGNA